MLEEFMLHPVSAIWWLIIIVRISSAGENFGTIQLFFLLSLLLYQHKWVLGTGVLCLAGYAGLSLINCAFGDRHTLPINTLLVVIVLRELVPVLARSYPLRFHKVGRLRAVVSAGVLLSGLSQISVTYDGRRTSDALYAPILVELGRYIGPESVVASSYPQLFSFALKRKSVGNAHLLQTLPDLIAKHSPDFIVLDDIRPDPPLQYTTSKTDHGLEKIARQFNYQVVFESREQFFCILGKRT